MQLRFVGKPQVLRQEIVSNPERRYRIERRRREIIAIVAIPGRWSPSPGKNNRTRPGMISPTIKSRVKVKGWRIAVVRPAAPIDRAVSIGIAAAAHNISPLNVTMGPTIVIAALVETAAMAVGNQPAATSVTPLDHTVASQAPMNIHAVGVEAGNSSVTEARLGRMSPD